MCNLKICLSLNWNICINCIQAECIVIKIKDCFSIYWKFSDVLVVIER